MLPTIKRGNIQLTRAELPSGAVAYIDARLPTGLERLGHIELRTGQLVPAPSYGPDFLAAVLHIAGLTLPEVQRIMNTSC